MNQRKYYERGRHPKGFWGLRALKAMNGKKHAALPKWVFSEFQFKEDAHVLDVGCGGGANLARLLKFCPSGHITGLDMSELALEESKDLNYHAHVDKLCSIVGGNATQMPLARDMFDVVTAFETIYYWSSLEMGASEIFRVLKPGGTCIIANEMDGLEPGACALERAISIRIYSIEEIIADLTEIGFTHIQTRHDEQRHFICVTAQKPN